MATSKKSKRGGKIGAGESKEVNDIQSEIDRLKKENVALLQENYTGRKGWAKQLESKVNKATKNQKTIEKLEKKLEKAKSGEKKGTKKSETKTAPIWKRAGEGWYIGANGHEIRENYDKGGYDIVKVSGRKESTVKHFSKLSEAKKYNVK